MRTLLFVDCWPDIHPPGVWRDRFAAVGPMAAAGGFRAEVHHFSLVDPGLVAGAAPERIVISGSRSNLMADPAQDPVDGVGLGAFAGLTGALAAFPRLPVLGICFGHQYLNFASGGALELMPGERADPAWPIAAEADPIFAGVAAPRCVESHCWRVAAPGAGYRVIARSADGIEGVRHDALPRVGVQFHPEYFTRPGATDDGRAIFANWLRGI
jgi:GMP synthase-like glutamine amidotransferase